MALQGPYLLSSGVQQMVLGTPEMDKIYNVAVRLDERLEVYVLPLVYLVAFITFSIVTFSILPGRHMSVITDTAKQGRFICLATIFSGTVDIPTASAPILAKYSYSADVSRFGPVTAA